MNDGGPAFPLQSIGPRDYFAAAALQAIISASINSQGHNIKFYSASAYDYADGMLAVREQEKGAG